MRIPFSDHNKGFEAVPAVVVADQTDRLGKRLGLVAFGLLFLFFTVNGYIQSARNGRELSAAASDRTKLVNSLDRVTTTLDAQSDLILALQQAIKDQNATLRKAGLTETHIPQATLQPNAVPSATSDPMIIPRASAPSDRPRSNPSPSPKPSPTPSPSHSPSPTDTICYLTGICV